jgi:hypothetical protein
LITIKAPITEANGRPLLLQRSASFTVENGHWVKGEEDEQRLQNDVVRPFVLLIHAVLKGLQLNP